MSAATSLPLRDVQLPPAPAWFPPAPGWWWLLAAALLVGLGLWAWQSRKARQRRRCLQLFDTGVDAASTALDQVAAIAELLRRAARQRQPGAELLHGQAWLAFLDEPGSRAFSDGDGALLLDGAYRAQVDPAAVQRLRDLARARFLGLMTGWRR